MNRRSFIRAAGLTTVAALCPSWLIQPAKRRAVDLTAFCLPHPHRCGKFNLSRPFVQADWTFATDSRICLRVPPESGDVRDDASVNLPPAAPMPWWDHDQRRCWHDLPATPPRVFQEDSCCPACDGTGWNRPHLECEVCQGVGALMDDSPYEFSDTWKECAACRGSGILGATPCGTCKGRASFVQPTTVQLGGQFFDLGFYRKIQSIGGVEYAMRFDGGDEPLRFRFDGGLGLLMGIDQKTVMRQIQHGELTEIKG